MGYRACVDDDVKLPRAKIRPARVFTIVVIAAVVLGGMGAIGHVAGSGWFGYRSFLYGGGELYALNMSDTELSISVDGRERIPVKPRDAAREDLVGGTSTVEVFDQSGKLVEAHEVAIDGSDAFLKLTDDGCVAVVDITPFYSGGSTNPLRFEAYLKPSQRVWIPQSRNVVWPTRDFPSRLAGGEGKGMWFELVACELFDEPTYLDAYLATRIENRMKTALKERESRSK